MKRINKRKPCLDCREPTTKTWCKPCGYNNRVIPVWNKGLKGIHLSPATEFKKGNHYSRTTEFKVGTKPWNTGTKGLVKPNSGSFSSINTKNEKNTKWKGKNVGYFSLHMWLTRNYGKPKICEYCNSTDKVQWASKTYKYIRDRNDWLHLCYQCHRQYDRSNGWGIASQIFDLKGTGIRNE